MKKIVPFHIDSLLNEEFNWHDSFTFFSSKSVKKLFFFFDRERHLLDLNEKYKNVRSVISIEKNIRTKIRSYLKFRFGDRKITNSSNVFRNATAHTRK